MERNIVNATRLQIEEFKKSILWKDMKRELRVWKRDISVEPLSIVNNAQDSNPTSASVLMHLGDVHGRLQAIEFLIGLPDMFLNLLEDKVNDTNSK